MIVLTVNTGSTSVKLAAFAVAGPAGEAETAPRRVATQNLAGPGPDPAATLRAFLLQLAEPPIAVAHRVVHGGTRFTRPTRIDAARAACGNDVTHVAAFDTAFFSTLPRVAAEYALPPNLGVELGVRRYGFHGLAHEAMWRRWCE